MLSLQNGTYGSIWQSLAISWSLTKAVKGNSNFIKSSLICIFPLTLIGDLSTVHADWYSLILMLNVVKNDLEIVNDIAPAPITIWCG